MDLVLVLIRLVLAGVFVVSGLGKLLDLPGSQKAMRDFGVPDPLAKVAGVALPLVELLAALLLLGGTTATAGAILSLGLLLAFIVGIGWNLSRGRRPDCNCFGQIHSEPIGWRTLARNGVLAALALVVAVSGLNGRAGPGVLAWTRDLNALGWVVGIGFVLIVAATAVSVWLLVHLLGQNGRMLNRLDRIEEALTGRGIEIPGLDEETEDAAEEVEEEAAGGLPVGAPAPAFSLRGVHGETLTLDALRARGKPAMLLFTDPNCGPCNALMPDVGRWQRDLANTLTVALVSRGSLDDNRRKAEEHGLQHLLLQPGNEVSEAYRVAGTPSAIIVGQDGTIVSKPAAGAAQIRALVARQTPARPTIPLAPAAPPAPPAPSAPEAPAMPRLGLRRVGHPAPEVSLPDLDGRTVTLEAFRGTETAMLFWNPGCGFCQRMLPELKQWEENPPADAPRLLVVSTGDAEANRAQGIRSPMLLDDRFATGRLFGVGGTPSAVVIDAEGRIASGIGVGAPEVLGLLRNGAPTAEAMAGAARDEDDDDEDDDEDDEPLEVPEVGTPAPALRLPDLDGNTVDLADRRGRPTLLLFWDPECGFCQRLLPTLRAWESNPPAGAPDLLLVSGGSVEENRAQGLRSTIVLDDDFEVAEEFGADGTPSAILVDAEGRVASGLAEGEEEVMRLVNTIEPKTV